MDELTKNKRAVRAGIYAMLKGIEAGERHAAGEAAARLLMRSRPWREAETIFSFASLPSEIDTSPINRAALEGHKRLALPRITGSELSFHLIEGLDELTARNEFGILEPDERLPRLDPASEPRLTIIVPGLAFTARGERLGRGGGYYDRLLPLVDAAATIGLCYERQLAEELPTGPDDAAVAYLCTERRIIATGQAGLNRSGPPRG